MALYDTYKLYYINKYAPVLTSRQQRIILLSALGMHISRETQSALFSSDLIAEKTDRSAYQDGTVTHMKTPQDKQTNGFVLLRWMWDYSAFISGYLIRKCNPLARMWTNRHTQHTDNVHTLSASSFKPVVSPLCFVTGWIRLGSDVWHGHRQTDADNKKECNSLIMSMSSCGFSSQSFLHKMMQTKVLEKYIYIKKEI